MASQGGFSRGLSTASMQWVTASMPVAAVRCGGRPRVSVGSQIAVAGMRFGETMVSFTPVSRMTTAPTETSEPVPAVVGMATSGGIFLMYFAPPVLAAYFSYGPSWVAIRPTILAMSMLDPPPSAMMPSAPDLRYLSVASRAWDSIGLGRVSSKMPAGSPDSASVIRSSRPAALMPGSVTIKGRVTPSPVSVFCSMLTAP